MYWRRAAALSLAAVALLAATSHGGPGSAGLGQGLLSASDFAPVATTHEVILALRRDRALYVFDAGTLDLLGEVRTFNLGDRLSVRPDGGMLYIAQAASPDDGGCCALFALDLTTMEMCRLIAPAQHAVLTPDGGRLFTQRGNAGIEVFDARTLDRLPAIAAPGVYRLYPSLDSRWLFGATVWQGPTLDLIDIAGNALVRRLPIAAPSTIEGATFGFAGAWLGDRFFLYAHDGQRGYLWSVGPDTTALGTPRRVTATPPDLPDVALPRAFPVMVAAGQRLLLYEPFGWWLLPNLAPDAGVSAGGVFELDPDTAQITAHLAPSIDLAYAVPSADRHVIYGLDAGAPNGERPVRLLVLDGATGETLRSRPLPEDVWFITAAVLPHGLVLRGNVQPAPCSRAEPPPPPPPPRPPTAPTRP